MISTSLEPIDWYKTAIDQWLKDQSIEIASITREEHGIIPMHETIAEDNALTRIGAASGAVRLSSGYAFTHIQRQTTLLQRGLKKVNFAYLRLFLAL